MADVTDATFAEEVIERSHTVPVIVDLWAEWCGPCKTLGPMLDKVVGEAKGLVELAKVDVDQNPQVSQAFQVQSIPAVYAMRDGQVVDGFMGAVPEAEVVAFVQRLIDSDDGAGDPGTEAADGADDDADARIEAPPEEDAPEPIDEAAAAEIEAELETLLITVKIDDSARERYLELLDQLGPDFPSTNTWRRRLTTALF